MGRDAKESDTRRDRGLSLNAISDAIKAIETLINTLIGRRGSRTHQAEGHSDNVEDPHLEANSISLEWLANDLQLLERSMRGSQQQGVVEIVRWLSKT